MSQRSKVYRKLNFILGQINDSPRDPLWKATGNFAVELAEKSFSCNDKQLQEIEKFTKSLSSFIWAVRRMELESAHKPPYPPIPDYWDHRKMTIPGQIA